MINIVDKIKCCGCTACSSICPLNCIKMKSDDEGFLYPFIEKEECIECGLCEKVCPVINADKSSNNVSFGKCYAVRSKELKEVKKSTSGGMFPALLKYMVKIKGCICAAAYDCDFEVKHIIVDTIEEKWEGISTEKICGSKYVQSSLNDCYMRIKELLKAGRTVCFVGTTCQAYGLKSYLQKDYSNLYIVDLICHGVPSPLLWKKYKNYLMEKNLGSSSACVK